MNLETVSIKCPHCGAKLRAKMTAGLEQKNVTCPVCKERSPFTAFIKEEPKVENLSTDYGVAIEKNQSSRLGHIRILDDENSIKFELKLGKNVVGRKAAASNADIQIPLPAGCNKVSREHFVIEVIKTETDSYKHCISLFKQKVNETFVEDVELEYGICLVLNHGDKIKMPGISLIFENA